jgi:hypothetical protein
MGAHNDFYIQLFIRRGVPQRDRRSRKLDYDALWHLS